jgi:hypothetical protein
MTTVKQLIEYLKKLPPETECQVLVESPPRRPYAGYEVFVEDLDLREYKGNVEFTDFTGEHFKNVKPDVSYYKKKYLLFGER